MKTYSWKEIKYKNHVLYRQTGTVKGWKIKHKIMYPLPSLKLCKQYLNEILKLN